VATELVAPASVDAAPAPPAARSLSSRRWANLSARRWANLSARRWANLSARRWANLSARRWANLALVALVGVVGFFSVFTTTTLGPWPATDTQTNVAVAGHKAHREGITSPLARENKQL
jgi:hypothetical protein